MKAVIMYCKERCMLQGGVCFKTITDTKSKRQHNHAISITITKIQLIMAENKGDKNPCDFNRRLLIRCVPSMLLVSIIK